MAIVGDNTFIVDQKFTIQDISSFGLDSPEEFIGLKCYEQIFASVSPCENCPVPRAFKAGMSVESRVRGLSLKNSHKSRRIKAIPLRCKNTSTHLCIVNCYQDDDSTVFDRISSIRRQKKKSLLPGSRLNIIKDLPMLAVLLDSDMNVIDYNHNAAQTKKSNGTPGPLSATCFPHLAGIDFKERFYPVFENGKEKSFTIKNEKSFFRHTLKRVLTDDKKIALLVLSDDLSDIFETDLALEKSPYNTMEILSELEHDLKNPLNVILIEMQELQRIGNPEPEGVQKAQSVINQLEIINEYFDRIRLLQPFSKDEMEESDFTVIINNAINSVKMQIQGAKVNFEFSFEEKLPHFLCCEYNLQNAIQQVLLNAVEACDANGTVEINLKYENEWFFCTIVDFGVGFPKELEKKIFDVFFTTKKHRKADGVGLSIAHSVVFNHGGTIELASKENVGTTVIIKLPEKNSGKKN